MAKQRSGPRTNPADDGQLSLFSNDSNPLDNVIKEFIDHGDEHNDTTGLPNPGALGQVSAEDGRVASGAEPALEGDLLGTGVDGRSPIRTGGPSEDGLPDGLGDRDEGMGVSSGRGGSAGVVFRPSEPRPQSTPPRDLRLTPEHQVGAGGLKQKAKANLEAILTLKRIESEGRLPTREEAGTLARYSGWGAIPNAFSPYPPNEWRQIAVNVRELLTPEEYSSARASTPNAHYTSPEVIGAVWQALERFGLQAGATILEPSAGVGHFFGLMPEHLHLGCKRTGVELDSITGRIAANLYPDSTIHQKAFEATPLPKNFFDAAIGNIPFGNYPVFDPAYSRTPRLTRAIHDYFLAKTVDVVRPGGVVALITSRYTMDKQDSTVRDYLAERTSLLGAIRLPNSAFKDNAGTSVTTDILFLQKHGRENPTNEHAWRGLGPIQTDRGRIEINEYFIRHPEMMLGRMELDHGQYGAPAPELVGQLNSDELAKAISNLPVDVYRRSETERRSTRFPDSEDHNSIKDGGFSERDGKIVVRRGGTFQTLGLSDSASARVRGMVQIRVAVRDVFQTQLTGAPDQSVLDARLKLNYVYDSFVSRFGPLNNRENVKAFTGDPDGPLLLSLENFDPEEKRATKTAIFERPTLERYRPVHHVEKASEALLVSLNEKGSIDWPRMEALTQKDATELQDELGPLVYQNPEGGHWETADLYLSGNVRAKLIAADSAAQIDAAYGRNAEALRTIQPPDLQPGEIEARLGSSWIPTSDVRAFVSELLDVPATNIKVGFAEPIATWTLEPDAATKYVVSNRTTHGTSRFRATDLIEQALNGRTPTAYDEDADGTKTVNQPETIAAREKQQQLKDGFREWIWEDRDRAERLASDYNMRFNNVRLREFDGSHLTLSGMVRTSLRDGDLAPHQKNAVWRILQGGSPLLAHVVGAGKTWTMTAAAMELKRLDLAKKPMFVVPTTW